MLRGTPTVGRVPVSGLFREGTNLELRNSGRNLFSIPDFLSSKFKLSYFPIVTRFDLGSEFLPLSGMGNSFGHLFRITTWGESHGGGVGVVVDGCPPRLALTEADIQPDLDRRRPGQSKIVTPRKESDTVQILSGTFEGKTLGTPISLWVKNEDARPEAYSEMATKFRPSHADYTYQTKYGIRNWQGGGRSSARETVGRVAAGAIAKKILRERFGVEVLACVTQVKDVIATVDVDKFTSKQVEANIVRCPKPSAAREMLACILEAKLTGDSVGGIVLGVARKVPVDCIVAGKDGLG